LYFFTVPFTFRSTAPARRGFAAFVSAEAQHLFTAAGSVPLAQICEDNVEERLEFECGLRGKHRHQLFGDVSGARREKEEPEGFAIGSIPQIRARATR
jgi:hypothetical protein